jgi:TetR/AcrR family transcriptional repressor of nem operon
MARPFEFEPREALEKAMRVFWRKGFAATSTADLVDAMDIGRQSLYNTFGDKKQLYLQALEAYAERMTVNHLRRLNRPKSPLKGIRELLTGLFAADDELRSLGCMGVDSVAEFGTTDPDLMTVWSKAAPPLSRRLIERIEEGQACKEIDPRVRPADAADFVQVMMAGLQIAARGGADLKDLQRMAAFAAERLKLQP